MSKRNDKVLLEDILQCIQKINSSDYSAVWKIVQSDLPSLSLQIEAIIHSLDSHN
jgi:uncharacterized protein with HEPN domain